MENNEFCMGWFQCMLNAMRLDGDIGMDFTRCAEYHYESNGMDQIIEPYIGDLDGWIQYLQETWGWIISKSEDECRLLVDENKEECVCPVTQAYHKMGDNVSPILCNCSEKFAERMFSKIIGKEVKAKVIRSVLRDGKSCIYEINICPPK